MRDMGKRMAAIVLVFALVLATVGCDGKTSTPQSDVINAISALPAVAELTVGDASAVEDARTLYDALSEEAQAKVSNYDKLTAAESVMATLMRIVAIEPSFASGGTAIVGVPYVPQITGYAFGETETTVAYAVKPPNTAGAVLENGTITAANPGTFVLEAVVSYAGYNIKRNAERTVTVSDPAPPTVTLSGQLTYDANLTDSVEFTGARVKIGTYDATVTPNGSWTADVPYDTYTVTATHPWFVTKTVENFEVKADTEAPAIEFTMFKAQGSIAHKNDGNETVIPSNFSYDMQNEIYQTKGGLIRSGISRINFDAMEVKADEDFVFSADLLYTGYMGAATSFSPNNAYHHGLAIYDGSPDIKNSRFSYGLLLCNAVTVNGTSTYKGHFAGFSAIDTAPTQYAQMGSTPSNVYCGMQGAYFGTTALKKPGNNKVDMGQDKITLTYVRKSATWYMIAEIYADGTSVSRYVRQATGDMLNNLNSISGQTIYLGLVNQVTSPRTGDYDQIIKWGNLYFATGEGVADNIDLTTTTN